MVMVPDSFLKGNYGEAYVAFLLSSECLVRTTTSDIGVDLYCESVVAARPFSHFWVQVKTGNQVTFSKDRGRAWCRFKADHLVYWRNQPVPVFAALIPAHTWPPPSVLEPTLDVYIVDISSQLLDNPSLGAAQESISLSSDYRFRIESLREDMRRFVHEIVPQVSARLLTSKGVIPPIPEPEQTYVKRMPDVPAHKYQREIAMQIRRTASTATISSYNNGQLSNLDVEFRKKMKAILGLYGSWWDAHFARGLLHHTAGEFTDAVKAYDRSIQTLEDPRFRRESPDWRRLESEVKRCKALASRDQPLSKPQAR